MIVGSPVLIIIRGFPGSGKSQIAERLAKEHGLSHYENDMFFMVDGEYKFEENRWLEAHNWCLKNTGQALLSGRNVVVSNVFARKAPYLKAYLDMACDLRVNCFVYKTMRQFGNVHNVPARSLEKMRRDWQNLEATKMKLINLTPHEVVVLAGTDEILIRIPADGRFARAVEKKEKIGNINDVPLHQIVYGSLSCETGDKQTVEMPSPQDETLYIVSQITATAMKAADRNDYVITSDAVRDKDGKIIGCRSFARL